MTDATDAAWVEVATVKEMTRHKKKYVTVEGQPVALFFVNERAYALHDTCMHKERQLSKGTVLHGRVICPGHQWAFDLETGWVELEERCQPTYETKIDNDVIYVNPVRRVLIESDD